MSLTHLSVTIQELYSVVSLPPPSLLFNFMTYIVSFSSLSIASAAIMRMQQSTDTSTNINQSDSMPIKGGLELGLWLFIGSTCQITGIQSTSAIKASILVQLTTVIVPVLESVIGNRRTSLSPKLWISRYSLYLQYASIPIANL
jgi:drug/metabolite transporter (DMT)-like permease